MTEPLDWNVLTPAQRNMLVAEKVMGWTSHLCDKSEPLVYYDSGDAECPRCGAYGFGTSFKHGIIPPPRYSESMDAAWLVLLKLVGGFERWNDSEPPNKDILITFADVLLKYGDSHAGDEIYPALEVFAIIKTWTPERICHAAWQAIEQETQEI